MFQFLFKFFTRNSFFNYSSRRTPDEIDKINEQIKFILSTHPEITKELTGQLCTLYYKIGDYERAYVIRNFNPQQRSPRCANINREKYID